jgi:hypothetical protein
MRSKDKISISMRHALYKDGEITSKIHIFANLEIFKEMIAFLQFSMGMEGSNAHNFAETG